MVRRALVAFGAAILALNALSVRADYRYGAPPCQNVFPSGPRTPADICPEVVLDAFSAPPGASRIMGLAFGPEGALYFASPAQRAIYRLLPDGASFFGAPEVFAANLPEAPVGLAYDAISGAWYISGDRQIVRLQNGRVLAIVGDLPGGQGGWLGNVRIGPDRRLYVTKGIACDTCPDARDFEQRRGALLSFNLDGGDMRIEALGLRAAFDFAWTPARNSLFIADDAADGQPDPLYRPPPNPGEMGWFGAPILRFPADSNPSGMVYYEGEAFPAWRGNLIVALAGSWNAPTIAGYGVWRVPVDGDGQIGEAVRILPDTYLSTSDAAVIRISYYPYRLAGIAVSQEGWLYTAMREGRIYRFRPRVGP